MCLKLDFFFQFCNNYFPQLICLSFPTIKQKKNIWKEKNYFMYVWYGKRLPPKKSVRMMDDDKKRLNN